MVYGAESKENLDLEPKDQKQRPHAYHHIGFVINKTTIDLRRTYLEIVIDLGDFLNTQDRYSIFAQSKRATALMSSIPYKCTKNRTSPLYLIKCSLPAQTRQHITSYSLAKTNNVGEKFLLILAGMSASHLSITDMIWWRFTFLYYDSHWASILSCRRNSLIFS